MPDFTNQTALANTSTLAVPMGAAFGYETAIYFDTAATSPRQSRRIGLSDRPIVLKPELVRTVALLAELGPLPILQNDSKAERRRRKAAAKRANTLDKQSIAAVERYIFEHGRSRASDLLKFRLSLRAGLRAGEISALRIEDMLNANGSISDIIEVRTLEQRYKNRIRTVGMHPEIREALAEVRKQYSSASHAAFSIGRDGEPRHQSAGCVANWFHRLYKNVGLLGCSSHSGRRTFATDVARLLPAYQGLMRDLQIVMGHARIASTECYLEPSNKMRQIIMSLGS